MSDVEAGRKAAAFVDALEGALVKVQRGWVGSGFGLVPSEDKGLHVMRLRTTLRRLDEVLVSWEEQARRDGGTVTPAGEPAIAERIAHAAVAIAAHDRASGAVVPGLVTDLLAGLLHTLAGEGDNAADTLVAGIEVFTRSGGVEDGRPWGSAADHYVEFAALVTATLLDRAEEITETGAMGVLSHALTAMRSRRP